MDLFSVIFTWQTHFAEVIDLLANSTLLTISWDIGGLWMPFGLATKIAFPRFLWTFSCIARIGRSWFLAFLLFLVLVVLNTCRWNSSFDCLLLCWSDLSCLFVTSIDLHTSKALFKDKSFSLSNLAFVSLSCMQITSLSRIISSVSVPNWQEDARFLNLLT